MSEKEAQCLLGHGICPNECGLHKNAAEITTAMGANFDPAKSRRRIVFADAFNQDVTVVQVAGVMAKCARESCPQERKPSKLTLDFPKPIG
ncbi:MAG: hypothetical protein ACD_57C00126G0001 [uncultured bacterium]|uniref:Uncharacterized protein n=1 Tax=Candidatus Curtissbacteria bacterium RIFOXYA1_FULL_41_14 TaxID=1797737 RepID=A0A1F5HEL1_9BACT|nr:MAG: hypothetical protein ACD_57C00126G0001 [uncultured bacterium]KKR60397.1 MAG: hypothetical protein UT99_C0015G0007 [Candidatus Curtissbacteria bacterium GW2011_GWA2_40_31]KKS02009.1 MAG: hypothetical protein UU53_C0005G0055 [Candidatus Curtissbacteria bacterium GW2011_GWC2_41_21]OGD79682.1 MAG: hypothetical protein A2683_01715 [Candidatus Curtissbacteria bacterium RIFCSPHIGHO2_01_FULL_34_40]OGD92881.1 MAG: hypothetical protein A3E14_01285 [Candidatus Curtissbacteria bacterium RIFCSPHIGHO